MSICRLSKKNERALLLKLDRLKGIFFNTNAKFLENDYMMSNRAKHDINWMTMGPKVLTPTILVSSSTLVPRRSGKVVIQSNKFMYLGESFEVILEEHETDLTYYNETMSNDEALLWQRFIEAKLESMYSNKI